MTAEVNPGIDGRHRKSSSLFYCLIYDQDNAVSACSDALLYSPLQRLGKGSDDFLHHPVHHPEPVPGCASDGSFVVCDPAGNYWRTQDGMDVQDRPPAYVFSSKEVWDGLPGQENTWLCNGLIRDWAGWQKEKGATFKHLKEVLKVLSPFSRRSA